MKITLLSAAAAAAYFFFSFTTAIAQDADVAVPFAEGVVEEISLPYPPVTETQLGGTGPIVWSRTIRRFGTQIMQLEITDRGTDPGSDGTVEFWDSNGEARDLFDAATLAGEGTIWTNVIVGNTVDVVVRGGRSEDFKFEVTAVSYEKSGIRLESITGDNNLTHMIAYTGDFTLDNPGVPAAVAKLSIIKTDPDTGQRGRGACTGFMVSEDLMITNEHCVNSAQECRETKILFGFEENQNGNAVAKDQYACGELVAVSAEKDAALLRVKERFLVSPPGSDNKYGHLTLASGNEVTQGTKIFIIQHPGGEPKQISDIDCLVDLTPVNGYATDLDFAHTCDTITGSSGSPVLNGQGEVVGLHHLGHDSSGRFVDLNRAVHIRHVMSEFAAHLP
ncbi:MAG: serine protease [Pseudomonadota bacterium]